MAPYQEGEVISCVELVLPKNVIDACQNLRVGVGAEFLATNLKKLTTSRIKLFKQGDESVKLRLLVQALKTRNDDMPEHVFIEKVSGKKGEKEVPAESFCQMVPSSPLAISNKNTSLQSTDLHQGSEPPVNVPSISLLSSTASEISTSSIITLAQSSGRPNAIHSSDHVPSDDIVHGLVCRDDPLLSSQGLLEKCTTSVQSGTSSFVVLSSEDKVILKNTEVPSATVSISEQVEHVADTMERVLPQDSSNIPSKSERIENSLGENPTETVTVESASENLPATCSHNHIIQDNHDDEGQITTTVTDLHTSVEETEQNNLLVQNSSDAEVCDTEGAVDTPALDHDSVLCHSDSQPDPASLVTEEQEDDEGETVLIKEELIISPVKLSSSLTNASRYNRIPPKKRPNYKRERNMECPICPSMVKDYDSLFDHLKSKHSTAPGFSDVKQDIRALMQISCDICGKVYSRREQLNVHKLNMHQDHTQAKCPQCGITVKSEQHLKGHMRRIHSTSAHRFLCHLCPASFKLKNYLSAHLTNVHSNNPTDSYRCDQCGKSCTTMKYLRNHKTRVHGAKKYVCHYCSTGFTNLANMKRHIDLVHEKKERSFRCEECGKTFALKNNLKEHVKGVHLKEFNIHCEICNSGFRRKKEYEVHKINVHGQAGAVQLLINSDQKASKPGVALSQEGGSVPVEECGIQYIVATPEMLEAFNIQVDFSVDS